MTDSPLDNPYAPPLTSIKPPAPGVVDGPGLALHRKNLGHVTAIRSLGMVHFVCAGIDAALVAMALFASLEIGGGIWAMMSPIERFDWVTQVFVSTPPLIGFHLLLGRGLRRLAPWTFRAQVGLSVTVIAALVVMSYWDAYGDIFPDFFLVFKFAAGIAQFAVLYYFLSSKCRRVFEPSHRVAVDETPELRLRRNWWITAGIVPFAIAFDWGVLKTIWRTALIIAWVLGFEET